MLVAVCAATLNLADYGLVQALQGLLLDGALGINDRGKHSPQPGHLHQAGPRQSLGAMKTTPMRRQCELRGTKSKVAA